MLAFGSPNIIYWISTSMKKFLYNMWKDWSDSQNELVAMGICHITSFNGYFVFIDKDQYSRYLKSKQKEKQNEH